MMIDVVVVHVQVYHIAGVLWALFQSEHSVIDYFDFINRACTGWTEYKARKETIASLEMP
jgi:hypothetical protein